MYVKGHLRLLDMADSVHEVVVVAIVIVAKLHVLASFPGSSEGGEPGN